MVKRDKSIPWNRSFLLTLSSNSGLNWEPVFTEILTLLASKWANRFFRFLPNPFDIATSLIPVKVLNKHYKKRESNKHSRILLAFSFWLFYLIALNVSTEHSYKTFFYCIGKKTPTRQGRSKNIDKGWGSGASFAGKLNVLYLWNIPLKCTL